MVITEDHHVWVLNSGTEDMQIAPGDLFGFGTGQYTNMVDCASVYFQVLLAVRQ